MITGEKRWERTPSHERGVVEAFSGRAARLRSFARARAPARQQKEMAKKKRKEAAASDDADAAGAPSAESVDDIFASLHASRKAKKAKKPAEAKKETAAPAEKAAARRAAADDAADDAKWKAGAKTAAPGDPSVHRYTPEGLPVYKYFHLGMNQEDGGTPQCPFDCECCF